MTLPGLPDQPDKNAPGVVVSMEHVPASAEPEAVAPDEHDQVLTQLNSVAWHKRLEMARIQRAKVLAEREQSGEVQPMSVGRFGAAAWRDIAPARAPQAAPEQLSDQPAARGRKSQSDETPAPARTGARPETRPEAMPETGPEARTAATPLSNLLPALISDPLAAEPVVRERRRMRLPLIAGGFAFGLVLGVAATAIMRETGLPGPAPTAEPATVKMAEVEAVPAPSPADQTVAAAPVAAAPVAAAPVAAAPVAQTPPPLAAGPETGAPWPFARALADAPPLSAEPAAIVGATTSEAGNALPVPATALAAPAADAPPAEMPSLPSRPALASAAPVFVASPENEALNSLSPAPAPRRQGNETIRPAPLADLGFNSDQPLPLQKIQYTSASVAATATTAELAETPANPAIAGVTVSIFSPPDQPDTVVNEVTASLEAAGFSLSAPSRVPFTIKQAHVRYYHPEDATAAEALAAAIGGPARDFTGAGNEPPAGSLEVWLPGKAAAATPKATKKRSKKAAAAPAPAVDPVADLSNRLLLQLRNTELD